MKNRIEPESGGREGVEPEWSRLIEAGRAERAPAALWSRIEQSAASAERHGSPSARGLRRLSWRRSLAASGSEPAHAPARRRSLYLAELASAAAGFLLVSLIARGGASAATSERAPVATLLAERVPQLLGAELPAFENELLESLPEIRLITRLASAVGAQVQR